MMEDGFGPATDEDVHLSAHLVLKTGDGKELARVDVEQLLRGVFLQSDPNGADGRLGVHFRSLVTNPLRCRLAEFIKRLRLAQPSNEYFGRIDAFFAQHSPIAWYDHTTRPMSAENARRMARIIMDRKNDLSELD